MRPPDRAAALAQYRRRARIYDLELAAFEPIRRRAVAELDIHPGETVLDLGCGTGLSLPLLRQRVGPHGRVIGVEQSAAMLARAHQRVREHRWSNVALIEAPVEEARIGGTADAALFHFTHDILCRPDAVGNVMQHLKPGAHVVATGLKWARPYVLPTNLVVLGAALHSVTSLAGLDRPWRELEPWLAPMSVRELLLRAVFVASGRLQPADKDDAHLMTRS